MNLNALILSIAGVLATYLLHSTIIIGGTRCGLRLGFVKSVVVRERMWKLAMIFSLATAPAQFFVSGHAIEVSWPAGSPPTPAVASSAAERRAWAARFTQRAASDSAAVFPDESRSGQPGARFELSGGGLTAGPRPGGARSETLLLASLGLWCAACLLLYVRNVVQVCRRLRVADELVDGRASACLARLLDQSAIHRSVRLVESGDFAEPFACGWNRWAIVVPKGSVERLNDDELEALLAHELAHLARGDVWWNTVAQSLCGWLPVQPLHFVARRHWRQAAEMACDDWALDRGADRLALARCLTKFLEWRLAGAGESPDPLVVAAASPPVLQRVERLLSDANNWRPPREGAARQLLAAGCLAMTAVVGCALPSVVFAHPKHRSNAAAMARSLVIPPVDREDIAGEAKLNEEWQQLRFEMERVSHLLESANSDRETRHLASQLRSRVDSLAVLISRLQWEEGP